MIFAGFFWTTNQWQRKRHLFLTLSKNKMNGKKLSKFQFFFPGLLFSNFPNAKIRYEKNLIIGHWRYSHLSNIQPCFNVLLKQSWITKENEHFLRKKIDLSTLSIWIGYSDKWDYLQCPTSKLFSFLVVVSGKFLWAQGTCSVFCFSFLGNVNSVTGLII